MEYPCQVFPEVLILCSLGLNKEGLSPHRFVAAGSPLHSKVVFGRTNLTCGIVRLLSPTALQLESTP